MVFLRSLAPVEIPRYHSAIRQSVTVRNHLDALVWLQGDMQRYLSHDIMIAVWGNFHDGAIRYDILSTLVGVRSKNSNSDAITPLLQQLFTLWAAFGHKPFALNAATGVFLLEHKGLNGELGDALQDMGCAMVHGITDERCSRDCLYILFSAKEDYCEIELSAMATVLPYIDATLRQVKHLPHQVHLEARPEHWNDTHSPQEHDLSNREVQILQWVTLGKTNPEIGCILEISEFTVKNHLQRVFKKLNVYNRAQAVGKFKVLTSHG